jgi:TatA/E family protein of Tat protein translocase
MIHPVLGFIGPIGWQELLIILALVLIVFGPRKLPEIAEAFGKSINKFKSATRDATEDVKRELDDARQSVQDGNGSTTSERPAQGESSETTEERPHQP